MAAKKKNFSIKRLIYNDKYLIIISLVLAVIIWGATSLNIGTDESKTIRVSVPIELGDEVSEQLGMQYYSLKDTVDLNVTVTGAKYVIGQVEPEDLSVKFDTSSVNRTGEQTIPILVSNISKNLDFDITGTYPQSIEGYFDVSESKTFDLNLRYDEDNVADGYVFGFPVLSEDKVIISGPKSYVDKIESVDINVNFGNTQQLKEPYNANCNLEIVGSGVETSYLTITSRSDTTTPIRSVSVTLPVLKVADLPVAVNLEDKPQDLPNGIVRIVYSEDSIKAGVLDSADINTAVIGNINFNEILVGTKTFNFDVTQLKGITVLDEDMKRISATVTVDSSYSMQSIAVNKNSIFVEGIPDGYRANVKSISSKNINVIAPKSTQKINAEELVLKCDVSEKNKNNVYNVSVSFKNMKNSWVYGEYTATIELVKE